MTTIFFNFLKVSVVKDHSQVYLYTPTISFSFILRQFCSSHVLTSSRYLHKCEMIFFLNKPAEAYTSKNSWVMNGPLINPTLPENCVPSLTEKKDLNHFRAISLIPTQLPILEIRLQWSIVSEGALMSKNTKMSESSELVINKKLFKLLKVLFQCFEVL